MATMDILLEERKLDRLARACRKHEVSAMRLGEFLRPGATHEVSLVLRDAVEECVSFLEVMD
jgi:hypothetical protein